MSSKAVVCRGGVGQDRLWWGCTGLTDYGSQCRNDPAWAAGIGEAVGDSTDRQDTIGRWRSPSGRKKQPEIEEQLLGVVKPDLAGDPMKGQCWVRRSLAKIRQALGQVGHWLAIGTIRRWLRQHKIHPKSNVKHLKSTPHPDRDPQFTYIERQRQVFEQLEQPTISVDTKKKELFGNYRQTGQVWCDQAPEVNMHDFPGDAIGKAVP